MRLVHKNFPGKTSLLKSIEVKGDSLLWTYQSGFFSQHACVPISSLVSVQFDRCELTWHYRIFANDGSGRVDDVSETLSAQGYSPSEIESLRRLYWILLENVHPHEFTRHNGSARTSSQQSSSGNSSNQSGRGRQQKSANNTNRNDGKGQGDSNSASGSSNNNHSSSQSSAESHSNVKTDIKNALLLLGGSLNEEKKRKLKSTLRLVHHPDHGSDQDFFIALQAVLIDMDW